MFKPESFFNLKEFPFRDIFKNINYVWEALDNIESFIKKLPKKSKKTISDKIDIKGIVIICDGVTIDPFCIITGPAIIGKGTHIRPFSYIRENTIIGENCAIRGEIKNSIILNNTALAHFNYVGDSIVGNNVNMGGGSKLANLKLNNNSIRIRNNKQWIDTGRKKMGAIIGDNVQIGCNSVINPGTIIGKRSIVYPVISPKAGFYPEDKIIKE